MDGTTARQGDRVGGRATLSRMTLRRGGGTEAHQLGRGNRDGAVGGQPRLAAADHPQPAGFFF